MNWNKNYKNKPKVYEREVPLNGLLAVYFNYSTFGREFMDFVLYDLYRDANDTHSNNTL